MKPFKGRKSRLTSFAAGTLALGMVVSACGGAGGNAGSGGDSGGSGGSGANPGGETILMGNIGWKENVATNKLWKSLLEERGYDVQLKTLGATTIFQGLAQDELDLFLDAWLPNTHQKKMEKFGDSLAKVGSWYNNGTLEWTVPGYMTEINSIGDLKGKAEMFGGKITGIGPTAGLTRVSKNKVIPSYGLGDNYELQISSSSAMVGALDKAIAAKKPIVVTLWHPHVAYTQYDLKDLKDPKGALGEGEKLWALSREGFAKDNPKVAKWIKNFQMSQEQLRQLEDLMFNQYPDDHQKAIDEWVKGHEDLINKWIPKGSGA